MEQNRSFSEKKRKQKNHSKTSKDIRVSDNNSDHIMTAAADDSGPPKSIIDNAKKVINSLRMIEVKKEQQGRPQTDIYD